METIGLDIGGANLKAAHSSGVALSEPFELWRRSAELADVLRRLLERLPPADQLAITMTGELCDCYDSKRQGVNAILDAVEAAAGTVPIRVWRSDGQFASVAAARTTPARTASANWLALACFAGRFASEGGALVIDIGSTTTDIIPLLDGRPVPLGASDPERLAAGELVYLGARRTPVCALLGADGAAEFFATTLDVYLLLEKVPEDPSDYGTADGRPATRAAAHARLARMLCADPESMTPEETRRLAERIARRQVELLAEAIRRVAGRVPAPPRTLIAAGSGACLVEDVMAHIGWRTPVVALADRLGPAISTAACAYALAVLARERAVGR